MGIVEIIALLLGLAGFGLQPNPKAPTPDQSLQYAMPDADVVIHVDAQSLIPGNYKLLTNLANQPQIKSSPELSRGVTQAVAELEAARGLAKSTTGIDFSTDISDATMFLKIVPGQDPTFVAAVRGKLSVAIIDKVAKTMQKQATKIGGGAMIEMGPNDPALAVTKDGVLLAGDAKLLRARLADTWKAPARAANSNLSYVQETLAQKPVFSVILTMSPTARKEAVSKIGSKNFITDVISRHKFATFSIYHDGVGWTFGDTSKAGLDAMAMVSEGTIDLMRASQIAPRGVAKILLGALDSYKGTDKRVDELIRRKADIMKIVQTYTGDGNFKAQVDKDPVKLRLSVRATGKSLSEVLPIGGLVPIGFLAMFSLRDEKMSTPTPSSSPPIRPAPRPKQPAKPVQPPVKHP